MGSMVTAEVHERRHSRAIDKDELFRIVTAAVLAELGLQPNDPNVDVNLVFEDAKEGGSLPYKVGTKALVTVVHDISEPFVEPTPPGGRKFGG